MESRNGSGANGIQVEEFGRDGGAPRTAELTARALRLLPQIVEIKSLIVGKALSILIWFIPAYVTANYPLTPPPSTDAWFLLPPRRMIGVTECVYLGLYWPIFNEFGWTIYKRIGADRAIKRYFMWYHVFVCIIKFGELPSPFPSPIPELQEGNANPERRLLLLHRLWPPTRPPRPRPKHRRGASPSLLPFASPPLT